MLSKLSGQLDLDLLDGHIEPAPFAGLPQKHFGAILADPPYHFRTYSEKGQGKSPSQHYLDMMIDEIAALPVPDLAADDCWLFLWIPDPHVKAGFQLMEKWGFELSGKAFTWVKYNRDTFKFAFGLGHTTRKNTESCWLGRRGKAKRVERGVSELLLADELIVAKRREHSRKPDEQYGLIERYCAGPYLELFARQRRSGWISWGDQVDQFTPDDYDSADDISKSVTKGFSAIRQRKAAGGPGWGE